MSEPGKILRTNSRISLGRVICPSCQMSLPNSVINLHLDRCTSRSRPSKRRIVNDVSLVSCSQPDVTLDVPNIVSSTPTSGEPKTCRPIRVSQSPQKPRDEPQTPSHIKKTGDNNLFAKMMESSKKAFASRDGRSETTATQSFYLGSDTEVTLRLKTLPDNEVLLWSRWSAIVTVKDRAEQGIDTENPPLSFDIHLSTAIAGDLTHRRWVRNHSRLSIPVLKSLLQKSIRRRRPLDSVRIAMELADKELGALLRRLPIIILEDSTLHDGLDFLVWVMMAQSKGFKPPETVMTRIFKIVFEVASCPRHDLLDDDTGETPMTLTKLYNASESVETDRSQALLWAMLIRAEYGGMKGDVQMLRRYATLWTTRFSQSTLPDEVLGLMSASNPRQWADVPSALHTPSKQSSDRHVCELLRTPIDRLRIENLCPEGIDFHCSSVLEYLVANKPIAAICHDLLLLSGSDLISSDSDEWLQNFAKRCMWKYSAGLNRRLPLMNLVKKDDNDKYKQLWTELLEPCTLAFQKQYISQRLVGS
jgi:hypothetical protein